MAVLGWRGMVAVFGCPACGRLVEINTAKRRREGGAFTVIDQGDFEARHSGSTYGPPVDLRMEIRQEPDED